MARLLSASLLLALLASAALVSAYSLDDEDYYGAYAKRARSGAIDGRNFPMSFGKRSAPSALNGGLDRMGFRINFGKRSAAPLEDDDDQEFEQQKRMDKSAFRVGFGRR
ncbi:hypothetical protein PMAYCL1PPCAC_32498 [Pristionchus mayeri]|uniref:Uncharacterized protein n=1 Tax=Pristionchus mayeri TaxID=1317129 RepID=A0AAN5DFK5_9BILA|nr:hypothetical protein PMAYCL1PPCAC_32498 [Pristionchus mayeri]